MTEDEWVDGFMRKVAFHISKIIYLWAKWFIVPSLNVTTKTNLGFILFLTLCRDIEKKCREIDYAIS